MADIVRKYSYKNYLKYIKTFNVICTLDPAISFLGTLDTSRVSRYWSLSPLLVSSR